MNIRSLKLSLQIRLGISGLSGITKITQTSPKQTPCYSKFKESETQVKSSQYKVNIYLSLKGFLVTSLPTRISIINTNHLF